MAGKNNGLPPDQDTTPPDEEHPPELVPSRPGRMVSIKGLVERVIQEFLIEHGENESAAIKAAQAEYERRKLVRDIAEYVFGVESVHLELTEKSSIIGKAYSEIFGYGPLDALFAQEDVTTIVLEGASKLSIRYQPGTDLVPQEEVFEDTPHMKKTVARLLRDAGAQLREDVAIVEAGLSVGQRRVSISVAIPPYVPELAVDIRVHPEQTPTLDDLVSQGIMDDTARRFLEAIISSQHGFMVIGDTESGKTTLMSIIAQELPESQKIVAVERAGEMTLPESAMSLVERWPVDEFAGITFGERIQEALEQSPDVLILDEIRADEPETIAPLLNEPDMPRQIWSFRGTSAANRTRSALGMLARMADRSQPEAMVFNLSERLPFMVMLKRRKGYLQLKEIAEWQFPEGYQEVNDFVYADYVSLLEVGADGSMLTGHRPHHDLDLEETFWE